MKYLMIPLLALTLLFGLSACSSSKNQNPIASSDEVGSVTDDESFAADGEKPAFYTAKSGDTLRKIAGRPEIYGDPNLWPVLQEANADEIGQRMSVNKGVRLSIPRDLSTEQIEMAHEKARQVAAANKMSRRSPKKREATPVVATPEATAAVEVTPVPAQPVPEAKKSGMLLPVLFVLLLILAALAVVLFYFMKKENKEDKQD